MPMEAVLITAIITHSRSVQKHEQDQIAPLLSPFFFLRKASQKQEAKSLSTIPK